MCQLCVCLLVVTGPCAACWLDVFFPSITSYCTSTYNSHVSQTIRYHAFTLILRPLENTDFSGHVVLRSF